MSLNDYGLNDYVIKVLFNNSIDAHRQSKMCVGVDCISRLERRRWTTWSGLYLDEKK